MSVEWLLKFSYSWLNDCWTNPTALLSAITSFLLTHDSDRLRAGSSLLSPNTAFYGRIRTRLQIIKPLFLWCTGFTWWVLTVAESQASYKKHICGWNLVWIYDIFPQIVAEILRADVEETTSLVWADVTSYGEAAASTPHVSIRRPIWCLPHVNSDLTRPFDFMYFNQPLSLCSCLTPWSEYSLLMVENVHSPSKRLETSLRGWSFALADLSHTHTLLSSLPPTGEPVRFNGVCWRSHLLLNLDLQCHQQPFLYYLLPHGITHVPHLSTNKGWVTSARTFFLYKENIISAIKCVFFRHLDPVIYLFWLFNIDLGDELVTYLSFLPFSLLLGFKKFTK